MRFWSHVPAMGFSRCYLFRVTKNLHFLPRHSQLLNSIAIIRWIYVARQLNSFLQRIVNLLGSTDESCSVNERLSYTAYMSWHIMPHSAIVHIFDSPEAGVKHRLGVITQFSKSGNVLFYGAWSHFHMYD